MRLFYEHRIYDYETKEKAEKHIACMRAKGWIVKYQYAEPLELEYRWTVEYHRGAV